MTVAGRRGGEPSVVEIPGGNWDGGNLADIDQWSRSAQAH